MVAKKFIRPSLSLNLETMLTAEAVDGDIVADSALRKLFRHRMDLELSQSRPHTRVDGSVRQPLNENRMQRIVDDLLVSLSV